MTTHNYLQRFLLENSNWRGELVELTDSLADLLQVHNYPPLVRQLVTELAITSILLRATVKSDGALTLQYQNTQGIKLLLARCTQDYYFRAIARWDDTLNTLNLLTGFAQGQLSMTFQPDNREPLQSIIPVETNNLRTLIENYFVRSEQIPTRVFFAHHLGRSYGILLQRLPSAHSDVELDTTTLNHDLEKSTKELISASELLHSLFSHETLTLLTCHSLKFDCGCSAEKIKNFLPLFGKKDCEEMLEEEGVLTINCEFCGKKYQFEREEVMECFE
jgi:molecular chaperone Hsp33